MVQQVLGKRDIGGTLGRAIGESFAQGAQEASNYQRDRSRLSQAFQDVENYVNETQQSGQPVNPVTFFSKLSQAGAGIPGWQQTVSESFPTLYGYVQRKQGVTDPNSPQPRPMGGPSGLAGDVAAITQGQPTAQAQNVPEQANTKSFQDREVPPAQKQPEPKRNPSLFDLAPPTGDIPGFISDPNLNVPTPKIYTPDDILKVRLQAREQGYSPEQEERFVNDAKEFNESARLRMQDVITGYGLQEKLRQDTLENQRKFTEYLNQNAQEFASPDEQALALKFSEKYQNEPSFNRRLEMVKRDLRPYQAAKKGLERALERPLFGMSKNQVDLVRQRAQTMVDMGQKDQLRLMIAKGGQGDVEEALLLNPLPTEIEDFFDSMPKRPAVQESIRTFDVESPEYQKQLDKGFQKQAKYNEQMVDYVANNLTSGTYEQPGTNLLLLRRHLEQKGIPWDEAGKIIDNAVNLARQKNPNFKLDPHQMIDYQKLGYPPLSGEDYFTNVMNYLFFGKE